MPAASTKKAIFEACKALGYPIKIDEIVIAEAKPEFGDISSTIAFTIAKKTGKEPGEIAAAISKRISLPSEIESCVSVGGYLNFKYSNKFYINALRKVLREGKKFGSSKIGKGKIVVLDYSSPNIGKPLHIGHIRSTILGDSLKKILSFTGFKTIGINLLSDVGKQVAMLIFAMRKFKKLPKLRTEKDMLDYYVRINKLLKKKPELEHDVRDILERIEGGDKRVIREVKKIRELSLIAFKKNYNLLNVKFDKIDHEIDYVNRSKKIVEEALTKKVAFLGKEGEVVANLEPCGLPNCILLRSNKTTTYDARDLGIADGRYARYKFDIAFYLTDFRQNLHFRQVFKILELLGRPYAKACIHQGFGLVVFEEGIARTREGKVIFLEDVLKDAIECAKAEIVARIGKKTAKARTKKEIEALAKKIGIGAIKFAILRLTPEKNVFFDFKRMVSFEGGTSAYLQYACVRALRILEKCKIKPRVQEAYSFSDVEKQLIKKISAFPVLIAGCSKSFHVYPVTEYLLDVADLFNKFYETIPVIRAAKGEASTRLAIVRSVETVLKNGLSLLGIEIPKRM